MFTGVLIDIHRPDGGNFVPPGQGLVSNQGLSQAPDHIGCGFTVLVQQQYMAHALVGGVLDTAILCRGYAGVVAEVEVMLAMLHLNIDDFRAVVDNVYSVDLGRDVIHQPG